MMPWMKLPPALMLLDGEPLSFDERGYLRAIYDSRADKLVLRCSRQTEKSTTLAILIVLEIITGSSRSVLVVMPRLEQLRTFRVTRLLPFIEKSPALRRLLLGPGHRITAGHLVFSNGSEIFLRAAYHSPDAARGISADMLVLDEYQDLAPNALPVLEQCLSHATRKRLLIAGTPKMIDNQLEEAFNRSTRNTWQTRCEACEHENIPDESILGASGTICASCKQPISLANGRWVPSNPDAADADGFWFNHLMTPWIDYAEILSHRDAYDIVRFKNEVLGLPANLGDHLVTREQVLACCTQYSMAESSHDARLRGLNLATVCVGIDWGGGSNTRTALIAGGHDAYGRFHVLRMEVVAAGEDHKKVLDAALRFTQRFGGFPVAADGAGNGAILNRELQSRSRGETGLIVGIRYADTTQKMREISASEWAWNVDRTRVISDVFTHVREKKILFPHADVCESLLAEIWGETAEYNDEERRLRFYCAAGKNDDVVHALAYCLALSTHAASRSPAAIPPPARARRQPALAITEDPEDEEYEIL